MFLLLEIKSFIVIEVNSQSLIPVPKRKRRIYFVFPLRSILSASREAN